MSVFVKLCENEGTIKFLVLYTYYFLRFLRLGIIIVFLMAAGK